MSNIQGWSKVCRVPSDISPIQGSSGWRLVTQGGALLCPGLRNDGPFGLRHSDYEQGWAGFHCGLSALAGLRKMCRLMSGVVCLTSLGKSAVAADLANVVQDALAKDLALSVGFVRFTVD
jgi:hypothetical protein